MLLKSQARQNWGLGAIIIIKIPLIFLVNITRAIRISKTSVIWRTEGKDRTWVLWDLVLRYTWSWVGRCKVFVWIHLQPCITLLCTSFFGFWIKSKYTSPWKRSILAISGNEKPTLVRRRVLFQKSHLLCMFGFNVRTVLTSGNLRFSPINLIF